MQFSPSCRHRRRLGRSWNDAPYSQFFGSLCTTTYLDDPPRDLAQEKEDEKARRASIEKWEAFCKPQRTYDKEGVVRLVYAKKGCEFGRSE